MQMIQQADIVFLREQMRTKELVYRYIIYVELLKLLYITAICIFLDSSLRLRIDMVWGGEENRIKKFAN